MGYRICSFVVVVLALVSQAAAGGAVTLYVSPSGDDARSGVDAANALATPAGATARVRAMRAERAGEKIGPVTVEFAAGTYVLSEPWTLKPEDSGVEGAPVTYRAAAGARVVISGGSELPAWREATLNGRAVWATDCAAVETGALRSVWVGGERRVRARHPNGEDHLRVRDVPSPPKGAPQRPGQPYFRYMDEDAALWETVSPGTEVMAFSRWLAMRLNVERVEGESRIARLDRVAEFIFRRGDRYFLEGSRSFLDAPGEWWHDESGGTLYYVPMPGERRDAAGAATARLNQLLVVAGDPARRSWVHDAAFEGLAFEHARWWFAAEAAQAGGQAEPPVRQRLCAQQAAWGVPGAVRADGARRVALRGCTITHVDGYGVEFGRGCRDNSIANCTITDMGAGGVRIGEAVQKWAPEAATPEEVGRGEQADRTACNTVSDCTITEGGRVFPEGVGVLITQSDGNTVEHCRIGELEYSGVSIGWTWGYGEARGGGNVVRFNDIGPIGTRPIAGSTPPARAEPRLGDMGGVYTLGSQPGTVISDNLIHDVRGDTIAWGIYFDEGTSGVVAERNVVVRTSHGSFHQHYGRYNTLRHNLFMDPGIASLWRTRDESHQSFTIAENVIVVPANGATFQNVWKNGRFTLERNLYLYTDTAPIFPEKRTLEQWQATGQDRGSRTERLEPASAEPAAIVEQHCDLLGGIDLGAVGPRSSRHEP